MTAVDTPSVPPATTSPTPYAAAALRYSDRGWSGVLPLPPRTKKTPPARYTGHDGHWPTRERVEAWVKQKPDGNVALRLPVDVLVIDVDEYQDHHGAATLTAAEAEWGPLPPTWTSTNRPGTASGHRFYRLPPGVEINVSTLPQGPHVDLLRPVHRYSVVAPSVHPEGRTYAWSSPEGRVVGLDEVPGPHNLADLPPAWVEGLLAAGRRAPADLEPAPRTVEIRAVEPADDRVDNYVRNSVDDELDRLRECEVRGWAERWDQTTYDVACNLFELANSSWNSYTVERAHADLLEHAPRDNGFGPREHEAKWRSATKKVGNKARAEPDWTAVPDVHSYHPADQGQDVHDGGHGLRVRRANEIILQRVRYVWDGRIPLGGMTLLPGEEGIGKTAVGIKLMAHLTRGTLAGEFYETPRDVLVVAPEDGLPDVFVPRLRAAGADLDRVTFVEGREHRSDGLELPRDLDRLGRLVEETGAALVWIDSLVSTFAADVKTIAYKDTVSVVRAIGEFAQDHGIAVAAPWHLNKATGTDTAARMMDSRGFRTAARSVLLVVRDPDTPEGESHGIVALDKANGGTLDVPALRYRIDSWHYKLEEHDEKTGEVRDVDSSCAMVEWLGEVEGGRDLVRSMLAPALGQADGADHWLRRFLEDRPQGIDRARVLEAASSNGFRFSESAIKRAAAKIGVVSVKRGAQVDGRPQQIARWYPPGGGPTTPAPSRSADSLTRTTGPTEPTGETQHDLFGLNGAGQSQSVQSAQSVLRGVGEPTGDPTGVRRRSEHLEAS